MIDYMDYYLWQEVFDPEMKYECENCGTLFGDESVIWNGEAQCHVATSPPAGADPSCANVPWSRIERLISRTSQEDRMHDLKVPLFVAEQPRCQGRTAADGFRHEVAIDIVEGRKRPFWDIDNYAKAIMDAAECPETAL